MTHIDVQSALDSLSIPYHDLVTRRTGAAVRTVIEGQLAGLADGSVAFLDFSHIGVLDRSCADEFVAKLMMPVSSENPSREGYVIFRGVNDGHLDAIESVLHAHGLALVLQLPDGSARLVGAVTDLERQVWELVMLTGHAHAASVPPESGLSAGEAQQLLDSLARRRLVRRDDDGFCPLGQVA